MNFYIETLGCKVNLYESNYIKEALEKLGFFNVQNIKDANIIILNTCSVTNNADSKSLKLARRFKRENKESYLVICGCSTQNGIDKFNDINIDLILGNHDKINIPNIIKENYLTKKKLTLIEKPSLFVFENMLTTTFVNQRAYIKIQDGCNNFCSYCIIPYLRGQLRNKPFESVIKEAKKLANNCYKEIVLTGINTGTYKSEGKDLTDLVEELSLIDNLKRIRISSIEVTQITPKFINMVKTNTKLCSHLHIPLQSGSDFILKTMNRKYNKSKYFKIIKQLKKARKGISITTDIIVGHPHETKEMFLETIKFAKKIKFSKIHVFSYSKKEGTRASKMSNLVDPKEIKIRSKQLISLSNQLEKKYKSKFINTKQKVLIETYKDGYSYGHTSNYLYLKIKGRHDINDFYELIVKKENL